MNAICRRILMALSFRLDRRHIKIAYSDLDSNTHTCFVVVCINWRLCRCRSWSNASRRVGKRVTMWTLNFSHTSTGKITSCVRVRRRTNSYLYLEDRQQIGRARYASGNIEGHAGQEEAVPVLQLAFFTQLIQIEQLSFEDVSRGLVVT